VEEEKPESRRVFGLEVEEIARVTARVYGAEPAGGIEFSIRV
jgi:hypothetical protein